MEEDEEPGAQQGLMASEREIFSISGPIHLRSIDWNNAHHRTSVAASLVQGVYILERDRQQNRLGDNALASAWWDSLDFLLVQQLIDEADKSIFGAIYEYKSFRLQHPHAGQRAAPRYVIAFRGTINKPHSRSRDLRLDLCCLRDSLHQSSRFQHAMQAVECMVAAAGPTNIWLAGHSLGAALALLAGKRMTKMGFPIETYLFNPPFSSIPVEKIKSQGLKHVIRFTTSVAKAGIAMAVKGRHQNDRNPAEDEPFVKLSMWVPYLFINPADPICSEYLGYFKHRKRMEEIGAGKIERIATQNSFRSLFSRGDSEPFHLIPSAYLTINMSKSPEFKRAHGIHQWWSPDFQGQYVLHQFPFS